MSAEPPVNGEFDSRYAPSLIPEPAWGWLGTPGLVASRAGLDHSAFFEVTHTSLEDVGTGDGRVQRLSVQAHDAMAEVDLAVEIELLGSGLARARATVSSTGYGSSGATGAERPLGLESLLVMWPVPRLATEIQDYTGRWIRERTPQRTAFTVGTRMRDSRHGKPGHDSAFMLTAGTSSFGFRSGEVWATHVAWSGNSRTMAERTNGGIGVIGGGELLMPGEVLLEPGEAYTGPWVYASYGQHGLDAASARIHRWLRSRPTHPTKHRPVIVNTWEAVYFSHDESRLKRLADAAAEVGAERFVLDDGWFMHRRADNAGLGDWYVDPSVYPQGLKPLADYVRGKGLEFGLWVEPEMINPDSDVARAHPEWIAQPELAARRAQLGGLARQPLEARSQQVLDLTHPEAYAHIEERLHAVVAEVEPSYLKWDHNRDLLEAGNSATGTPIVHGQTQALYRLLDGLKSAFPGLEIESCAGGGGRIDLGILEHTDRVWASDTNDPLERQRIQLHTSLLVPPELMGTHVGPPHAHTTHRYASLDFRAGTALWGHMGLEWNVAGEDLADPATRDHLKAWIALHKRFRALLHSGHVVRGDIAEPGRILFGVVAQDQREALFGFAAVDSVAAHPVGLVRLEGLDPHSTYTLTRVDPVKSPAGGHRAGTPWTTAKLSGRVLAHHGVQVPGMDPQELVLFHVTAHGD